MRPSTFRRWIGPLCLAGLGVGALIGAVQYRAAVPFHVAEVVTTVTAPATPVTLTAAPATRVETVVLRPQAAVETRTVTVTTGETPEQRAAKRETVTAISTTTETQRVLQVDAKRDKERKSDPEPPS